MNEFAAHPLALLLAVFAAAGMGFAIQRGGTCMVSAVDHLVRQRSPSKLIALAECSLWTSLFGLIAGSTGFVIAASPSYPVGLLTLAGGLLLGAGAWLNGACVFGSIARIGGRDWHYLLTPPGYFIGSLLHHELLGGYAAMQPPGSVVRLEPLLILLALTSLIASLRALRRIGGKVSGLWDYRHATIAIGLAFVPLVLVAGPWTYTEALGKLSHRLGAPSWREGLLFAALLGGAIIGGCGLAGPDRFTARRGLLCLGGGTLMGFGGSMVPGGNDNLILVGLPGLQPHAWLAIAAMVGAIAAGLNLGRLGSKLRLGRTTGTPGTV
jgi:hypothetical protein